MPDFWALKFATWVASLHSLNWCKTGLLSTKPVAFASEPIRDQPADFQTVAQSQSYTVILQVTKSGLDVVTMNNDWCHMKVGCLVNICMLKVSCRFDLTPPTRASDTQCWVYRFRSKINSLSVSTFISSKVITTTLLRSTLLKNCLYSI